MQSSTAYKFAPIVTDEKKIDVSLRGGEAEVRLSTWVEDLGWCGQKTMAFDAAMLDELHRVIAAARVRLKELDAEYATVPASGKVLAFPS